MAEEEAVRMDPQLARLAEDVAELKGEVRQMSQRIANLEQGQQHLRSSLEQGQQQLRSSLEQSQRWVLGLIFGTWVTLAMGVVGLYFKG